LGKNFLRKYSYILILLFIGILALAFFLFREGSQAINEGMGRQVCPQDFLSSPKTNAYHQSNRESLPNHPESTSPLSASITISNSGSEYSDRVQMKIEELMLLGMKNDHESLRLISSALTNSEKDIRLSAADALVQFGDVSVVPRLRELASQAKNLEEQERFNEAAEQLSLPAFSELRKIQKR